MLTLTREEVRELTRAARKESQRREFRRRGEMDKGWYWINLDQRLEPEWWPAYFDGDVFNAYFRSGWQQYRPDDESEEFVAAGPKIAIPDAHPVGNGL